jgi:uncharacterized protein (TIGR02246 family)
MNDEQAIRQLLQTRPEATRRGDVDGMVAAYARDVVIFDIAPPLSHKGSEATDTGALREWLATWEGPVEVQLDQVQVRVEGDTAFAFGYLRMTGTKKKEGKQDMWMRSTVCLTRRDGDWKIVHEHTSLPMKMDGSQKVAADLTPP